ncbi:MAG: thioredoxin domain-containing protein [Deltaproteobacteria bacterium]|nr:thioredoxin domain-containing protein [Deltaproteobacteria bacterium]
MSKKSKIKIAVLTVLVLGGFAVYLFTIGPLGKPVLASVNGETISVARFQAELEKIDPATRDLVKEDPGKMLDVMITRTLLLQQAKKEGVAAPKAGVAPTPAAGLDDAETATIMAYLEKKLAALPPLAPEVAEQIYEAYKGQMAGRKKEDVIPLIRQMVEEQRQAEEAEKLVAGLRKDAKIEIDGKALQTLVVVPAGMETQSEADFRKALAGGKPLIVDFGSNSCLPCRQLRPVLQKVRQDYTGKLEVLIIDVQKYQQLAAEYQVQVIPTVVFFDRAGREVFRQQGFMSEEKVKERLAKLGFV